MPMNVAYLAYDLTRLHWHTSVNAFDECVSYEVIMTSNCFDLPRNSTQATTMSIHNFEQVFIHLS